MWCFLLYRDVVQVVAEVFDIEAREEMSIQCKSISIILQLSRQQQQFQVCIIVALSTGKGERERDNQIRQIMLPARGRQKERGCLIHTRCYFNRSRYNSGSKGGEVHFQCTTVPIICLSRFCNNITRVHNFCITIGRGKRVACCKSLLLNQVYVHQGWCSCQPTMRWVVWLMLDVNFHNLVSLNFTV